MGTARRDREAAVWELGSEAKAKAKAKAEARRWRAMGVAMAACRRPIRSVPAASAMLNSQCRRALNAAAAVAVVRGEGGEGGSSHRNRVVETRA